MFLAPSWESPEQWVSGAQALSPLFLLPVSRWTTPSSRGWGGHVGTTPSVLGRRLAKALTPSTTSPWGQETLCPSFKRWAGWEVPGSCEQEEENGFAVGGDPCCCRDPRMLVRSLGPERCDCTWA